MRFEILLFLSLQTRLGLSRPSIPDNLAYHIPTTLGIYISTQTVFLGTGLGFKHLELNSFLNKPVCHPSLKILAS
jgi:hypothetical protein